MEMNSCMLDSHVYMEMNSCMLDSHVYMEMNSCMLDSHVYMEMNSCMLDSHVYIDIPVTVWSETNTNYSSVWTEALTSCLQFREEMLAVSREATLPLSGYGRQTEDIKN